MGAVQFNFDAFVLDADARELRGSGGAIHLSPKAFELLLLLIERRPAAISKTDLHALLWQDTFVTDTSLAMVVNEIRTALGDQPRPPRYVRTVHGYGYAFCGHAVSSAALAGAAPAACWVEWDGRKFPLGPSENILGRAAGSSVVIDLPEVSRRHARITLSPAGAMLEDLESRNGTFVGDVQVSAPRRLLDGDEIRIGPASLTFHVALGDGMTTALMTRGGSPRLKKS